MKPLTLGGVALVFAGYVHFMGAIIMSQYGPLGEGQCYFVGFLGLMLVLAGGGAVAGSQGV